MLSDHASSDDEAFANDDAMITSSTSANVAAPRTPSRFPSASELSPPNSQPGSSAAIPLAVDSPSGTGAGGGVSLNANGKRVHSKSALGSIPIEGEEVAASGALSAGVPASAVTTEVEGKPIGKANSGYEWSKAEDEPGFKWKNKKAVEEYHRAMEQVVDRNLMVKGEHLR